LRVRTSSDAHRAGAASASASRVTMFLSLSLRLGTLILLAGVVGLIILARFDLEALPFHEGGPVPLRLRWLARAPRDVGAG